MALRNLLCAAAACAGLLAAPALSLAAKKDNSIRFGRTGAREHRPVLQQRADRRHHRSACVGHADLPRPEDRRVQGAARAVVEVAGRSDAGSRPEAWHPLSQRRGVQRRRRGVHAELRRRSAEQGGDPEQRELDREGREGRFAQGADPHPPAVPGCDRVSVRPGGDSSERVLPEGRSARDEHRAGGHRAVPRRRAFDRQVRPAGAQQGLLQGLAQDRHRRSTGSRCASSPTVRPRRPRCWPGGWTSSWVRPPTRRAR